MTNLDQNVEDRKKEVKETKDRITITKSIKTEKVQADYALRRDYNNGENIEIGQGSSQITKDDLPLISAGFTKCQAAIIKNNTTGKIWLLHIEPGWYYSKKQIETLSEIDEHFDYINQKEFSDNIDVFIVHREDRTPMLLYEYFHKRKYNTKAIPVTPGKDNRLWVIYDPKINNIITHTREDGYDKLTYYKGFENHPQEKITEGTQEKLGNITDNAKKEEMETLSQDKNQRLQADIIEYKEKNIESEKLGLKKWGPKPEMKVGDQTRQFDKMEPGKVEVDKDNVFKITIKTGDFLQVNNKQIYTNEDKAKELADLENKKAVERTEIQNKENLKLGKDYVCKFSFMIPKGFPLLANRLVIGQRKQMTNVKWASQNPFLAQKLNRNKLQFIINTSWDITGKIWSKTIAKIPIKEYLDKRIDMEYQFKFSDKDDGYLKIKMNWKEIVDYHWKLASDIIDKEGRKEDVYFKFWLYRDNYDYGIKVLKKNNEKEPNENLEKEIAAIEKAKEDEKKNPMTIYFKDYSVKPKE